MLLELERHLTKLSYGESGATRSGAVWVERRRSGRRHDKVTGKDIIVVFALFLAAKCLLFYQKCVLFAVTCMIVISIYAYIYVKICLNTSMK